MSHALPESDWRAFRRLREAALERFCERILEEIGRIVSDTQRTPYARYLAAYQLLQERDEQIGRAFNDPRRSAAVLQLATMVSLGLVTPGEMQSFTPKTRGIVDELLRPLDAGNGGGA